MSLSSDFFGQCLFDASKIQPTTFIDYVGASHSNISNSIGTVNAMSVSAGGKIDLVQRLLFTANVLFRVNDAGLHFKPAPLVGLSYTF